MYMITRLHALYICLIISGCRHPAFRMSSSCDKISQDADILRFGCRHSLIKYLSMSSSCDRITRDVDILPELCRHPEIKYVRMSTCYLNYVVILEIKYVRISTSWMALPELRSYLNYVVILR